MRRRAAVGIPPSRAPSRRWRSSQRCSQLALRLARTGDAGADRRRVSSMASTSLRTAR